MAAHPENPPRPPSAAAAVAGPPQQDLGQDQDQEQDQDQDQDTPAAAPSGASPDRDSSPTGSDDQMNHSSKPRNRDPNKPKRKKARRACAACQRAHLTCSDERPCERCIKRNLADQCQDGARKKAKYLHDAPNEALMPGHAKQYKHENGTLVPADQTLPTQHQQQHNHHQQQGQQHHQQQHPQQIQQQQQQQQPPQQFSQPAQPQQHRLSLSVQDEFAKMQSPVSSVFESQQPSPMHSVAPQLSQQTSSPQPLNPQQPVSFPQPYVDPGDAAMFNFDIPSMNFGNHYGALEFGMLGSMVQGQSPNGVGFYDSSQPFPDNRTPGDYSINSADTSAWSTGAKSIPMGTFDPMGGNFDQWRRNSQTFPHAYAIQQNTYTGQSPASSIEMFPTDFATPPDGNVAGNRQVQQQQQQSKQQQQAKMQKRRHSNPPISRLTQSPEMQNKEAQPASRMTEPSEAISKKLVGSLRSHPAFAKHRQRDPSAIYKNVTKPYPYTYAFHALTAVIYRRFHARKRLRIAKALASIRPSFISLNRNLTDADLVFMEQNFQRCIWDYEEDANACGTPTLIIRRTGEVAYADKEFTLLSGWTKDVLYGRSPNLNTNKAVADTNTSGTATATSSRGGFNTPRNGPVDMPDDPAAAGFTSAPLDSAQPKRRHQPVFLAELLDDDSVVDFYEEYSQRAFGDSRGTTSRRCKLLKYKAAAAESASRNGSSDGDDEGATTMTSPPVNGAAADDRRRNSMPEKSERSKAVVSSVNGGNAAHRARPGISSEEGMKTLGDEKGVVDCSYCWMVKQDCFNIPMLIVINFLPIL